MMVFKKKEKEPEPPVPPPKEEPVMDAFTAHIAMNGWVLQQRFTDGSIEEYVFVGSTSYDDLGRVLFPAIAKPLAFEKKPEESPVVEPQKSFSLTKEEAALLEALQKKASARPEKNDQAEEQL